MDQEILAAHNRDRTEVGAPPLRWSNNLANSAGQWANHLAATGKFEHSGTNGMGENLWMGTSGHYSFTSMVDSWGNEKQYFVPGRSFPDVSSTSNWQDVGHYTQVIWGNTTEVDCAVTSGGGNDFLVCQYSPPGNFIGQRP
ncbi:SCP-like extracellular [Cyanosarcina cf. burmensis CCALA 770]|nr:SCP-like extracellular [Cyanosarcina cf. burmensis CCALA 770]